jgi:uncharacterized protein (TIGR03066 family)
MRISRLAVVALVLLAVPACSSNRGKIVGKWASTGGNVPLAPGERRALEFSADGTLTYTTDAGYVSRSVTGRYSLWVGDAVNITFDQDVAGRKRHRETVTIRGDELTMKDSDGKFMTFRRVE